MSEQNPGAAPANAEAPDGSPATEEPAKGQDKQEQPEPDLASEGGSFTAGAANNPNKSSGHLGFQQAARQALFDSTLHDAVMGDKYVGTQILFGHADPKKLSIIKLSAEAVDEANAFVNPGDYERIALFARDRHLLVLTGSAGVGRTATALHLLVAETGRRSIYEVHSDADFALLADNTLPRGCGIIVRDVSAQAAATLDEFVLRRLDDMLAARGQRLIISAPASTSWGCGAVTATRTVELGERPDAHAVLVRQLRWRLGAAKLARADALLDRPDVAAVVSEYIGPDRPLADAARLAAILADTSTSPDAAAAARLGMTSGSAADFEVWFDGLAGEEDERDQCYAVALAVLHGLSNEKVAAAGKQLERFLAPETPEARDGRRPKRVFGSGNRARLTRVRAIQVPPTVIRPGDDSASPVIRFIRRDYPPRVLAHVWSEYDDARKDLTAWLRAVGDTPLEDVCVHAGVAVGALARVSYDHVFDEIVRPWALSGNVSQQDAAAVALQTIGADDRHAEQIRALMGEWTESNRAVSLQATAARVYGGGYGSEQLDTAVRVLTDLAEREHWPVVRAVAWSLSELIATQAPGAVERVFTLFGSWVGSRKAMLRNAGYLAFLFAAGDLVDEDGDPGRTAGKAPMFLRFDQDPRFAPIHRYLWVRVLNSTDIPKAARGVLTAWARSADENPRTRRALVELLREIALADRRAGSVVRLLTRDWAETAPNVASDLNALSIF